jgi:hypothetical protein
MGTLTVIFVRDKGKGDGFKEVFEVAVFPVEGG